MADESAEWTFATLPAPERIAEDLGTRTGWTFRVQPVERGVVAIVATNGEGGIRWAPVAEGVVRVDVHDRITPYLSWQVDAALAACGGNCDDPTEEAPIALKPWAELGAWQRLRHGGRGWLLQVVLIVLLALPMLVVAALFVSARPRRRDDD